MGKLNEEMLKTALIWWGIKALILVILYFWLIFPNLPESLALKNFINITYAFLAVFIIFKMKRLDVKGLFSYKK